MVMELQKLVSADEFVEIAAAPEYAGVSLELVEGHLLDMSKASGQHGQITKRLGTLLDNHVFPNRLGVVTAAETGFMLSRGPDGRDTVRGLDIAYISRSRIPSLVLPDRLVDVPPDLAVEVVSPSNTAADIDLKVTQLLDAGAALVWVVYPETRHVIAHTADSILRHSEDDTLDGGDVLPGFTVRVGDIFPA